MPKKYVHQTSISSGFGSKERIVIRCDKARITMYQRPPGGKNNIIKMDLNYLDRMIDVFETIRKRLNDGKKMP